MVLLRVGFLFVLLTLLTQIGGVAYLAARVVCHAGRIVTLALFLAFYAAMTCATAYIAPVFGRVPLSCFDAGSDLQVRSPLFCAFNRNYVTADLHRAAEALARHIADRFPGTVTLALDANFPFFDGFPLLPHLSHDDGRKLDIAFYYTDESGLPLNGVTRSPLGYVAFEQPAAAAPLPCKGRHDLLTFRWDMAPLQAFFPRWPLDEARTGAALRWLATEGPALGVEKIFIEPHLSARLAVTNQIVRFQGCRAARHDDHIHFQVHE